MKQAGPEAAEEDPASAHNTMGRAIATVRLTAECKFRGTTSNQRGRIESLEQNMSEWNPAAIGKPMAELGFWPHSWECLHQVGQGKCRESLLRA